jgi:hypothetical protein
MTLVIVTLPLRSRHVSAVQGHHQMSITNNNKFTDSRVNAFEKICIFVFCAHIKCLLQRKETTSPSGSTAIPQHYYYYYLFI